MKFLTDVSRSAGLYPISLLYVAAVAIVCAVASSVLTPGVAVIALGLVAILSACFATWRELRKVHVLVNGQRTELIARIDQLTELLIRSGVVVPDGSSLEQEARDDDNDTRSLL